MQEKQRWGQTYFCGDRVKGNVSVSKEALWAAHLDGGEAGGEVGGDEVGAGEPGAGDLEECVGFDLGGEGGLRPGLMRNVEEAAEGAVFGEGEVALEEEVVERAWSGRFVGWR